MSWNYRVVVRDNQIEPGGKVYGIHEAFYDDDDRIWTWTEEPVGACEDSLEVLRETLIRMLAATLQPVVTEADRTGKPPGKPEI
jgi:hypothetical protein